MEVSIFHRIVVFLIQAMGISSYLFFFFNVYLIFQVDSHLNSYLFRSKKKHKRKIRRILEDAELGEETKRKIAIEKVLH